MTESTFHKFKFLRTMTTQQYIYIFQTFVQQRFGAQIESTGAS